MKHENLNLTLLSMPALRSGRLTFVSQALMDAN